MSDDVEQVNPSPHIESVSKKSDSQRTIFAGNQLVTLLKAMTLLVFVWSSATAWQSTRNVTPLEKREIKRAHHDAPRRAKR